MLLLLFVFVFFFLIKKCRIQVKDLISSYQETQIEKKCFAKRERSHLPSYTDTELSLFSFPFSLAKCFSYWTMAVGFVLRWNLRNFFRLHASIAGNLRHPTRIFKANNSLSYKNNRSRRSFHNTSSLFVSGKESSSIDLSGIFPPIVTPFEDDEEVSYAKLEENFSKWNDIPFKGKIVLF